MARVIFMGTPWFAVPSLEALFEHHQVAGVVTQPDRPAGRGRKLVPPPVKEATQVQGAPIFQPESLRTPEAVEVLRGWQPEVTVVAAFGHILRADVLALAPGGTLNVHASLLPRHRGASPISAAILAGDAVTGVTIMLMDEGMDTGAILAQAEIPIEGDDTTATLTARLATLGAELLVDTLPRWLAGEIEPRAQDNAQASYCRLLKKQDGQIDWNRPAGYLDRQIRACTPWPGAYTTWEGRRLKVHAAVPLPDWAGHGQPGEVVVPPDGLGVVTGEGLLVLGQVQLAGKKPMAADVFGRGQRGFVGAQLGS